jgi:hypothetical protein
MLLLLPAPAPLLLLLLLLQAPVRAVMIKLRNLERADEGSPAPPDIVSLTQAQSLADVGVSGVLGAVVKAVADAAVAASGRV